MEAVRTVMQNTVSGGDSVMNWRHLVIKVVLKSKKSSFIIRVNVSLLVLVYQPD